MRSPTFDLDTMVILSTQWIDGGLIVVGVGALASESRSVRTI
jgi:hypothetical protein